MNRATWYVSEADVPLPCVIDVCDIGRTEGHWLTLYVSTVGERAIAMSLLNGCGFGYRVQPATAKQ